MPRDGHHARRLELLHAIGESGAQASVALTDRDLDELNAITERRNTLFDELRAVDDALDIRDRSVPESPLGQKLRAEADTFLKSLITDEAALRARLAEWFDETRVELKRVNRSRKVGRRYAAAGRRV